jgi:ribonuclease HI
MSVNWNVSEYWVDGGCKGNQAHGERQAYGSISDGTTAEQVQFADAYTNNEAEYLALSLLLGNLISNRSDPAKPVTRIYTDSQLLVGQLTQGWKVEAENLVALHNETALQLRKTRAKLVWVPRKQIVKRLGH